MTDDPLKDTTVDCGFDGRPITHTFEESDESRG